MFLDLVEQLGEIHKRGCVLGNISRDHIKQDGYGNWTISLSKNCYRQGESINPVADYIGWKNQSRAPEYRRACLRGNDYYPTMAGDIYELAYSIYEILVGSAPRLNFQLDRHWARQLEGAFSCDSEQKKAALQSLFDKCTQMSEYHRIQTCGQLKETKEFQLLFSDATNGVGVK